MKTKYSIPNASHGNVLIITLILCAIMGISLASYLMLTRTQLSSVRRSQSWNNSIAISEAGIEDAMMHINSTSYLDGLYATDGWTVNADGSQHVTRNIAEGY